MKRSHLFSRCVSAPHPCNSLPACMSRSPLRAASQVALVRLARNKRRRSRRGMTQRKNTTWRKSAPCPARTLRIDTHMHVCVPHSAHPLSLLESFRCPDLESIPRTAKKEQSCSAALSPAGCRAFADLHKTVEECEAPLRQACWPPAEALLELVI